MAEQIRDLIEKINQEGINAAKEKSRQIEDAAKQKADEMLVKARLEADKIIAVAKDRTDKLQENTHALLKQAGRDLLLALRKEINTMLHKIVVAQAQAALGPEELIKLIVSFIKEHHGKEESDVVVVVKKRDFEEVEKALFVELGTNLKKGITLKSSEDISGGFTISFDHGKSHYDFSDKALAEYIVTHLKPKLDAILKIE